MKRILVVALLFTSGVVFAQDANAPKLTPEDEIILLRISKQQSDLQNQYNALYSQFLQTKEIVALTSQNSQLMNEANTAVAKALDDAKADKEKWAVDLKTVQVVPMPPKPASK